MTRYLLDVNVLIALIDPNHVRHDDAHEWFAARNGMIWATCPLTENGVLRIVGSTQYPNSPGTPAVIVPVLTALRAMPGHEFWPDDLSLIDAPHLDPTRLTSSAQVTDTYLLALARAHEASLATFDRSLVSNAVRGGAEALHLIR